MSWDDHYRRRAAISSVLTFAEQNPSAALPFSELAGVSTVFADLHELLLALQYDWSQALWARIELLSLDSTLTDAGLLAQQAWTDCASKHAVLRRILDEHRKEITPSQRERDMVSDATHSVA